MFHEVGMARLFLLNVPMLKQEVLILAPKVVLKLVLINLLFQELFHHQQI